MKADSDSQATAPHRPAASGSLFQLWLAAGAKDVDRTLAFVTSTCLLFLGVGLIGLRTPPPGGRTTVEVAEIVPVFFTPPAQPPVTPVEAAAASLETVTEAVLDLPEVVTVVAADARAVAFAVPVEGPMRLASERSAAPSPQVTKPAPAPAAEFVPTGNEGGSFPFPRSRDYPREALARRQQGMVVLLVEVRQDGSPDTITVQTSSSYAVLDRFAAGWVRDQWRWPSGGVRRFHVPFEFHLEK